MYDFIKARRYRNKIRKIFIYPLDKSIKKHFYVSFFGTIRSRLCTEFGNSSFIWDAFHAIDVKNKSKIYSELAELIENDPHYKFYQKIPFIDKIKKKDEATKLFEKKAAESKYVYVIYEERNKVEKIEGKDVLLYKLKMPDVSFVDLEWTWIYMKSHEEGERRFDIGPYFYSIK